MFVLEVAARKARWTVQVISAADEIRNCALNLFDFIRALADFERKGSLD